MLWPTRAPPRSCRAPAVENALVDQTTTQEPEATGEPSAATEAPGTSEVENPFTELLGEGGGERPARSWETRVLASHRGTSEGGVK